jgi:hypothetical protein
VSLRGSRRPTRWSPRAAPMCLLLVALGMTACEKPSPVKDVSKADAPAPSAWVNSVTPTEAGLGTERAITVHVEGLREPANDIEATKRAAEYGRWVLYLNGRPMSNLHPTSVDVYHGNFHFDIQRSKDSDESWRSLFGSVSYIPFSRATELTVGPEVGGTPVGPLKASDGTFRLVVVPARRFWCLALAYVLLVVIVAVLGSKTALLRAPVQPDARIPARSRPFSLGRTQMAAWFLVVLAGYLFLGLITDDWTQSLNVSTLGLMGIATATAIGAQAIDFGKDAQANAADPTAEGLRRQTDALSAAVKTASSPDVASALSAELGRVHTRLANAEAAQTERRPKAASSDFLRDLVSDDGGVALHRVQIVVWTVVLGAAFLYLVMRDLAMPTFDPTLLTLMGISSGAYLGFKFPER